MKAQHLVPYAFAALVLAFSSCAQRAAAPAASTAALPTTEADLPKVAAMLAGNFNTTAQAAADKSYYDIRLHIVRVWPERPEYYFYVEQAMASAQDAPYRQRMYHLKRLADGRFESAVYTLRGARRFVGAWKNPAENAALRALTPDSLVAKAGCSVFLTKTGPQQYTGSTDGRSCPSELRGAAYATSEVVLTPRELRSWDRGYDAAGQQRWGAEKGGYVFVKE